MVETSWLRTVVFTPMLFQLCATTWQLRSFSVPEELQLDVERLDLAVADVGVVGRYRTFQDAFCAWIRPRLG